MNIYRVECITILVSGSSTNIMIFVVIQFMNLIHLFIMDLVTYFTFNVYYGCEIMFISCDLFHK
jgi:hypothetical protein